jgi:hypothetical protein
MCRPCGAKARPSHRWWPVGRPSRRSSARPASRALGHLPPGTPAPLRGLRRSPLGPPVRLRSGWRSAGFTFRKEGEERRRRDEELRQGFQEFGQVVHAVFSTKPVSAPVLSRHDHATHTPLACPCLFLEANKTGGVAPHRRGGVARARPQSPQGAPGFWRQVPRSPAQPGRRADPGEGLPSSRHGSNWGDFGGQKIAPSGGEFMGGAAPRC